MKSWAVDLQNALHDLDSILLRSMAVLKVHWLRIVSF